MFQIGDRISVGPQVDKILKHLSHSGGEDIMILKCMLEFYLKPPYVALYLGDIHKLWSHHGIPCKES